MSSNRMAKGPEAGTYKGQGSSYTIPADDMPEGIESGTNGIIKIYGIVNVSDEGGVIDVEKIEFEKLNSRDDPLQKQIEEGINIELKINK